MNEDESFRESEELFRGAFHAAAIGLALVDLAGRLRAVNEPLCRMLGYSEAELLDLTYPQFAPPADHAVDEALRLSVLAGGTSPNHCETRYLHKDGHVVWGLLAASVVRTGASESGYFIAQVTDITRQKAAEQALARRAAELECSNAELAEFAVLASHDLQEPLRTVSSYSELLAERYHGELDETGKRWITYIVGGIERMRRLIDDMLALARVRTAGGDFSETDVAKLVAVAWAELQDQYGGLGATLTVEALPTVTADTAQMEVLLRNLLANGLKYRRPNVPLDIRVSAERTIGGPNEESVWRFAVADNGIGLDMMHAQRIFEMFHRLHRDGEHEGTGIGLALCKRIVERHGGRIWVESVPSQGATFMFTLGERLSL